MTISPKNVQLDLEILSRDKKIIIFDKDADIGYPIDSIDVTEDGVIILNISLFGEK